MFADPLDVPSGDIEELYDVVGKLLVRTLPTLLDIAEEEAEAAVYDAFVGYLYAAPEIRPADWIMAAAVGRACPRQQAYGAPLVPRPDQTPPAPDRLGQAMALLSPRQREAVELALVRNLSPAEIAEALEITPAYARRLVRGAAQKLRRLVEEG